ncbi:MAG: CHAP domain-containing protein [Clostridia bacterium]
MRFLRLLVCLCGVALWLLCMPCASFAQELDEETLAQQEEAVPTPDPMATPAPPEQVYAVSDVLGEDAASETILEQGERPDFVERILNVARGELGYTEQANNLTKYGEWAGDPNAAWCAEFVCWCVDQADQLYGTDLLGTLYPKYSGQNTGRDWFIKRGRFVYRKGFCPGWGYQWLRNSKQLMKKNDYIPRSGDWVFFSYNEKGDTEHVAMIEYCAVDKSGNVIMHVIEGNNPSKVQRNSYFLNSSQVLGFGVCENVAGTTMRSGNRGDAVLWLQQSLGTLGLLEERHMTGAFGGNTRRAVIRFQSEYMENKSGTGLADRETQQALAAELEALHNSQPDTWLVEE